MFWPTRDGHSHPVGRRAGCPHPAAPRGGANVRGRIWNPPLRPTANATANRENAPPQGPREGHGPPLQTFRNAPPNRNGCDHPVGRRAGCPHPAAPRGAANVHGRDLRPKSRCCAAVGLRNAPAGAVNPAPTNKFYVLATRGVHNHPGRPYPRPLPPTLPNSSFPKNKNPRPPGTCVPGGGDRYAFSACPGVTVLDRTGAG